MLFGKGCGSMVYKHMEDVKYLTKDGQLPIIRITQVVAYVDSFVNRIREVELISTYRIPQRNAHAREWPTRKTLSIYK